MTIAYTMAPGRGDTDLLLLQVAQSLIAQGVRPAGTIQMNTERDDAGPCDMYLKVLPDGATLRISQSLGRGSKGCRLDPGALETAVGLVEREVARGADCLIINKFGKHEAEGRGFRHVIADAIARGMPVLVGLNKLNREGFLEFSGGMASEVQPLVSAIEDWLKSAISNDSAPGSFPSLTR